MIKYWPLAALAVLLLVGNCAENRSIRRTALLSAAGDSTDRRVVLLQAEAESLRTVAVDSAAAYARREQLAGRQVATLRARLAQYPTSVPRPVVDSVLVADSALLVEVRAQAVFWERHYRAAERVLVALGDQVADLATQRDRWKREARPSLFSLKRLRPGATCGIQLSGGTGCTVGLSYSL